MQRPALNKTSFAKPGSSARLYSPLRKRENCDVASVPEAMPAKSIDIFVSELSNEDVAANLKSAAIANGVPANQYTALKPQAARKFLGQLLRRSNDPLRYDRTMSPNRIAKDSLHEEIKVKSVKHSTDKPKEVPPLLKEVLQRCKAKGMSDAYFFRQIDTDGGNSITRKEFETGLAIVRLDLQPSEVAMIFKFFDSNGDGNIDYTEFASVMGDENAISQPAWNSSPPRRYRRDEAKAAAALNDFNEAKAVTKPLRHSAHRGSGRDLFLIVASGERDLFLIGETCSLLWPLTNTHAWWLGLGCTPHIIHRRARHILALILGECGR
jgi:hypothetical protein